MQAYYNRFTVTLTKAQARSVSHAGDCYLDVKALLRDKRVRRQLERLDPVAVRNELKEYGAWTDAELTGDHEANLERLAWLAGNDIVQSIGNR